MIPALLFASALAFSPEHRVADLRPAATRADERILALDETRAITEQLQDGSIRSVPYDDPSKATTLVTGIPNNAQIPVAAPPLMAWTDAQHQAHVAPIDAPNRGFLVRGDEVHTMKCNATACIATLQSELDLLRLDGTPYAHLPRGGAIALAADPNGFLVQYGPTTLFRVDNSGATTFTAALPAQVFNAGADFDGTRYALVWWEYDFASQTTAIRALSVGLAGDLGSTTTIATLAAAIDERIAIAWNAGRHLLVFGAADPNFALVLPGTVPPSQLDGLRLDGALQPLDAAPFAIDATPWADLFPLVIARGSGFLAGWSHSPGTFFTGDPEAATVDADGHVGPRMILSTGVAPQSVSSLATIPGALLVGYLEFPHEDGAPTLRVRRFGPDGNALGDPIVVAAADARLSAMAARGSDVLIAWQTRTYAVHAAILHADGTLQAIPLPPLSGIPSVAASRDAWMIAVAEPVDDVKTIRVDGSGTAAPAQTLVSIPAATFDAAVASDGDRFLVAWATDAGVGTTRCNFVPCGTRATLLGAADNVIASDIPISSHHDLAGATFAGGEYFVASTTGVRLDPNGTRLGDVNVAAYRVAPFGNAIVAIVETPDSMHIVVIDHSGVEELATLGPVAPVEITSSAVAYDINVGDATAVVFRQFIAGRHRAAYH